MRDSVYFFQQLNVAYKGANPTALPGIILAGLPAINGLPALLLVWDEGAQNNGTSATNCMEELLTWVRTNWLEFPVKTAAIVQCDSMGMYNHVYPDWPEGNRRLHPLVTWTPMRWPGCAPCAEESFLGVFAQRAHEAINVVRTRSRTPERGEQ